MKSCCKWPGAPLCDGLAQANGPDFLSSHRQLLQAVFCIDFEAGFLHIIRTIPPVPGLLGAALPEFTKVNDRSDSIPP
jgi:hypothetical protein